MTIASPPPSHRVVAYAPLEGGQAFAPVARIDFPEGRARYLYSRLAETFAAEGGGSAVALFVRRERPGGWRELCSTLPAHDPTAGFNPRVERRIRGETP